MRAALVVLATAWLWTSGVCAQADGASADAETAAEDVVEGESPAETEPDSEAIVQAEGDSSEPSEGDGDSELAVDEEPAEVEPAEAEPETNGEADSQSEAEPEGPRLGPRTEDAEIYVQAGNEGGLSTALGTATIVTTVVGLATMGYFIERTSSLDSCLGFEAEEPAVRGCLNLAQMAELREVALGLLIGVGTAAVALGVSWAIVAVTEGDAEAVTLSCSPGLGSVSCAGRF